MYSLEAFKIDLKGLQEGDNAFEYGLDDGYFEAIDAPDVRKGSLHVGLNVHRTDDFFELSFHIDGTVTIPCDLCLDDMEQPIVADERLVATFAEGGSDDDDQITVAEDEGILDVSWYIYEFIELHIPVRHVHAPGKCNAAMMKLLEEHSATRSGEGEEAKVDSRWAALSKLKEKD